MECNSCKSELALRNIMELAFMGKSTCLKCGTSLGLKNRFFVTFLLVLLLLFVLVASYFLVVSRIKMGMGIGWSVLTLLTPWVIFMVVFAMLVVPAMEVEWRS